VIDRGLSVAEAAGMLEVAGDSVDIVKLGWGTALVTANLKPKLELYEAHGIPVIEDNAHGLGGFYRGRPPNPLYPGAKAQ